MSMPNPTFTREYIADGQKAIMALKHFYDTTLVTNYDSNRIIRIPIHDFFVKYKYELEELVEYYNMPQRYFYKPKMVSLELYDTTEMWMGLLRLNRFRNITEFDQSVIKIYSPAGLKALMNIFFKREKKII